MGCDIHSFAEKRNAEGQWTVVEGVHPFSNRNYGTFGFLADVRNYAKLRPLDTPRGIPNNVSGEVQAEYYAWRGDAHSASWLSVEELTQFDYDSMCENRRVLKQLDRNFWSGACSCEPGEGELQSHRDFLGKCFFEDLQRLIDVGAERIVFWFDN